ncbi:type VII secretion-associated serine protease mycosin [Kitasatospora sp. NBC_01246]|uniref:type VII secretion-associated serine protease mycosin n=1 Tax=Kitasatospora sp. NBC_01246 TaxID=2903570 RepID=UPI002E374A73|nr:type VII secretion-associated serine protease mycosin [Kitasatospora sp. NBC_01246]
MKASEMWKVSNGQGVTVAVIDSGFKLDHPDLAGQLLPGKDFSGLSGGVGSYTESHGTEMAALVVGSGKGMNGNGAYGLAPGAKVLPIKIKNNDNAAGVSSSEFLNQIDQGIVFAADQGAKVISISQATSAGRLSSDDIAGLKTAVEHARAKGSLVVAGVGNSAQSGNPLQYPAALPGVLGVGAVDREGNVTAESEQGPQVDLVAPGIDIYNACTANSGYCKGHGTSDATALVSASAALVWAVHPDWTANQVLRVLINTAGKPSDGAARADNVGYGAVRPRIALTTPGDPGPADVSPIPEKAVEAPSASPSAAPSPSASASTGASAAASAPQTANSAPVAAPPAAQPPAAEASDSGSALPIVVAVVVGLVLVAGVVFLVLRRRGAATAAPAVEAPPAPVGYPQAPPQAGPGVPPGPPSYGPPAPPSDNPYAR